MVKLMSDIIYTIEPKPLSQKIISDIMYTIEPNGHTSDLGVKQIKYIYIYIKVRLIYGKHLFIFMKIYKQFNLGASIS